MALDVDLRELAGRQHRAVAVAQARALGGTSAQTRRRRAPPDWDAPTPRVLRLTGSTRTYRQRGMIAVLDAGTGACISHLAAAGLWQLPGVRPGRVEVSGARGTTRRPWCGSARKWSGTVRRRGSGY